MKKRSTEPKADLKVNKKKLLMVNSFFLISSLLQQLVKLELINPSKMIGSFFEKNIEIFNRRVEEFFKKFYNVRSFKGHYIYSCSRCI